MFIYSESPLIKDAGQNFDTKKAEPALDVRALMLIPKFDLSNDFRLS